MSKELEYYDALLEIYTIAVHVGRLSDVQKLEMICETVNQVLQGKNAQK